MKKAIIVITGMPRSGTSFTASLLKSAGLNIGQKLMAPGHGNIRGFFEDLDIVGFHEAVFRSQHIHPVGWTLRDDITVREPYLTEASELINRHTDDAVWGWKDPRTTLFLNFWARQLPEARFLLLYRAPWEVVDSIYRRGDEIFVEQPELAIKVWMHYNQKLIEFYDRFPERCLVASASSITSQTDSFIDTINRKFNIDLAMPEGDIYEPTLFHKRVAQSHYPAVINQYFPQAIQIFEELNTREWQLGRYTGSFHPGEMDNDYNQAFRDWFRVRQLEREVERLQAALAQIQVEQQELVSESSSGLSAD